MIVKLYQKNGSQQRIKEPIIKPKKKMSSFIIFFWKCANSNRKIHENLRMIIMATFWESVRRIVIRKGGTNCALKAVSQILKASIPLLNNIITIC